MTATLSPEAAPFAGLPTTPAELLFPDFAAEHAATRRLLERVPEEHASWRPHPRSRSLAELATHVAELPNRGTAILTTEALDIATRSPMAPLTTAAELVALHDASVVRFHRALAESDLPSLTADWELRRGGQVLIRGQRRLLLRPVVMSHIVHHRAQLGVYLRLLNVAIPGMYGPSADDLAVS